MDVGLSLGSNPFKLNNCKTSLIETQVSLSVEVRWYHLLGKVAVRKERKLASTHLTVLGTSNGPGANGDWLISGHSDYNKKMASPIV